MLFVLPDIQPQVICYYHVQDDFVQAAEWYYYTEPSEAIFSAGKSSTPAAPARIVTREQAHGLAIRFLGAGTGGPGLIGRPGHRTRQGWRRLGTKPRYRLKPSQVIIAGASYVCTAEAMTKAHQHVGPGLDPGTSTISRARSLLSPE